MYSTGNLFYTTKRDGFTAVKRGSSIIERVTGAEHEDRAMLWCRQQNFISDGVNAVGPALLDSRGVKIGHVGGGLFWEYDRLRDMPTLRSGQSANRKVLTHDGIAICLDRMFVGDYEVETNGQSIPSRLVWLYDANDSCVSIYIALGDKDGWDNARQLILRSEIEKMVYRLPWMKLESI